MKDTINLVQIKNESTHFDVDSINNELFNDHNIN